MTNIEITNIKKGFLGTIEFDLQCNGHRGFQNFIVYPVDARSNKIMVQSDKRIGYYYADNGEFRLSKSRANGSYGGHLICDKLTQAILTETDRRVLNTAIRKTSGTVGCSVMTTDNSQAAYI